MKATKRLILFVILLASITLALSLSSGGGLRIGKAAPGDTFPMYLPMVSQPFNTLYGHVTDNGSPAANVSLQLWRETGITASPLITVTTNLSGDYYFYGIPAPGPDQSYWVKYKNESNPDRLYEWYTRELTSFPDGKMVNIGNFDIANVQFTTPPGTKVVPPFSFQWTPRPATPTDSYQFTIVDLFERISPFYSAPLGYIGSYNLTSLPSGFQYCNPYFWGVNVYSPDGGIGYSYWIYRVIIHQTALAGIHGCITENSTPVSSVTLELWRCDASSCDFMGTDVTSNGYFELTNMPSLIDDEEYYIEYWNDTNPSRLFYARLDILTSYTMGSATYVGDLDIKNIPLNLPAGGATISLPALFEWDVRPNTLYDSYIFEVYDPADFDPYYESAHLGYRDNYLLAGIPPNFLPGTTYAWDIAVIDWWGGFGISYESRFVSFSSMGRGEAPPEAGLQARLDQIRTRKGQRSPMSLQLPRGLINRVEGWR